MRLLSRPRVREVHLRPWPPEAPRRRVVCAGGLERPEPEACITGVDLRIIHARGVGADAAVAGVALGARRYGGGAVEGAGGSGGEARKKGAAGEKEAMEWRLAGSRARVL